MDWSRNNKNVKWTSSQPLEFQSIDWIECDETVYENTYESHQSQTDNDEETPKKHNKHYTIFVFGVTIEGYSVCAKIVNYNPYFYIKIPECLQNNRKLKRRFENEFFNKESLSFSKVNSFENIYDKNTDNSKYLLKMREKLETSEHKSALVDSKITEKAAEIFWSFTNNTMYDFWKLPFQSKEGFHLFSNLFKHNKHFPKMFDKTKSPPEPHYLDFKLFESELEPLLRFFHDMKIKPSNWIKFEGNSYKMKPNISTCQINVEIDYTKIIPIDKQETAPLIIASFDIEADSSHGDFPLAKKDYKKLANQLVVSYLNNKTKLSKMSKSSQDYALLTAELKSHNYFKLRIIQAFDLDKKYYIKGDDNNYVMTPLVIDNEISKVYYKPKNIKSTTDNTVIIATFLKSEKLNGLCKNILFICDRDIKKVIANTKMKTVITSINFQYERKEEYRIDNYKDNAIPCNIHDLLEIIQSNSKKSKLPLESLKCKILGKDMLVKYVNQELRSSFPQVKGDRVIQIGTVFWKYGDDKPIYNNIITLKQCDPLEGIDVFSFEKERDVLLEWTKMIKNYDPDIILGYNIFGFDEIFMFDRANELIARGDSNDKKYQNFINIGRLTSTTYKNIWNCRGKLLKKKLASSALGANYLEYFNMPGRVQIDLLKVVQGGLTKLDSYKLDSVAEFYICGNIIEIGRTGYDDDTIINESNWLKVTNIKELEIGNYIIISLKTGEKVFNGEKLIIEELDVANDYIKIIKGVSKSILSYAPKWGISKDDVTPKQIFEYQKGTNAQRAIIAKYCIQDCALVIRLLKKLDTIVNNFGMSNVCIVPFSYIFMRGQGIKIFSLVVNECSENGFILPTLEKIHFDDDDKIIEVNMNSSDIHQNNESISSIVSRDGDDDDDNDNGGNNSHNFNIGDDFNKIMINGDGYEGAIVLDPKPGIYIDDPITVLDFGSLYPSEMIASNLSHDSHCEDSYWLGDEGAERIKALGYDYIDVEYDVFSLIDPKNINKGKKKTGVKIERFVQYNEGKKGLIPNIEMKLLGARKATKKKMKTETDPFKQSILDGLQLAYKVTANSLYGQMGASTSKIYKKAIAASTTAGGRKCIYRAKDYCLKNNPGCDVVYGDSIPSWEQLHLLINNKIIIDTVENIKHKYFIWNNNCSNKQYYIPNIKETLNGIYTFTEKGCTPILSLMEHKSKNDIIKIITTTGTVHVTREHSIILKDGLVITPNELKIGDVLMSVDNDIYDLYNENSNVLGDPLVTKIINMGSTDNFVYDLTTENHHFQAGTGNIVVHNTDSVFVKLNLKYEDGTYPKTDTEKVQRSIDIGLELQQKLKDDKYFTPPHDLEYEKVYYPLMLITKKRYAGEKFEFNAEKSSFSSMGIVLKRRDNAPILKHTYGGVMKKIMKEKNIQSAIDFVRLCCQEILDGKYELNMFVISKTLRDYYKDPESIAHKVLANRMTERDPGNKPASNERIPYAYIKVKQKDGITLLQGDKIEHINYITEHNLELDYYIYIKNQLLKPICQIFELVVENMEGFPYHKGHFTNLWNVYRDKYKGDIKKTDKKISELKQNVVAKLIFNEYMIQALNKQNKVNTLSRWIQVDEQQIETDKHIKQETKGCASNEPTQSREQKTTYKKQTAISDFF